MRYILEIENEEEKEKVLESFTIVDEIRPGLYVVESEPLCQSDIEEYVDGVYIYEDEEVHIMSGETGHAVGYSTSGPFKRSPFSWCDPVLTGDDIKHLDAIRPFLETAIKEIGADQAHQRGLTGAGVKIAIIDTGVDANHEAFILESGKSKVIKRLDFTDDENEDHYHGTHVAGIAASCHVHRPGVAPDADIIDVRVLDSTGRGWTSDIIKGIRAAAQAGAHVLNMSLGSSKESDGTDILSKEVNLVSETYGVVIVVAAGNSGGPVGSPAAAEKAITVGATAGEAIASFSSFNGLVDKPDVVAPGVMINSAEPGNKWGKHSGTSMATPFVAGFCALIIQAQNSGAGMPYAIFPSTYTPKEVENAKEKLASYVERGNWEEEALLVSSAISVNWTGPFRVFDSVKQTVAECTNVLETEPREKQGYGKIWIPHFWRGESPHECPWCHTQNSADHKEPCHNQNDIPANWSAWKLFKLAIKKIFE